MAKDKDIVKWIPVVVFFNEKYLNDMLAEPIEELDDMPTELFNKMLANLKKAKEDLQKGEDTSNVYYEKIIKYGIS